MVNPFDLRTILLAKHAQHVVLIHFPIALFITGVAFDLLSRGKRDSQLDARSGYPGPHRALWWVLERSQYLNNTERKKYIRI